MREKPDYAQLIASSAESFFVTDRDGNILVVNPAACMLLDLTEEQLVGANVQDLIKAGHYDKSTTMEAIATKRTVSFIYKTKSGKKIMATSRPIFDDDGNVSVIITNSIDTERVKEFVEMIENERALTKRYRTEVEYLRHKYIEKDNIVFISEIMKGILQKLKTVAKVDSTIILFGESGTGKDLMAKYIHKNSARVQEAFIDVNCAAIPEHLMESELFGYERGAFTGASSQGKIGLMELADKGTLFLDEIGEIPLQLQSKLLRAIENYEIRRVGSVAGKKIDFRLIAATNRDLKKMVTENKFRSDLYYRLNVIPVHIPPLRERPEDIIVLAEHFLAMFNNKYGYENIFSSQMIDAFLRYQWPGNVRELRNVVERLVITGNYVESDQTVVTNSVINSLPLGELFGERMQNNEDVTSQQFINVDGRGTLKEFVEDAENKYIIRVLGQCDNNVRQAAEKLGVHRTILYRRLKRIKGCEKTLLLE